MATIHDKLTAIGNAIRTKTGGTEKLSLDAMATEIASISSGGELNFEVVGGTTEPVNPKQNTIWVNTNQEITEWGLSNDNPFGIVVKADHPINSDSTEITIIDNKTNSILVSQSVTGTQYYSVFTNVVIPFVTLDGLNGSLTCSVRQSTTPFFTGTVTINGVTAGTVGFGTNGNSSYAWSGDDKSGFGAEEGSVWIKTGDTGKVELNALKDNVVDTNLLAVYQYVNGVWAKKSASVYQNGSWVDLTTYLFNDGDECTNITGGWAAKATTNTATSYISKSVTANGDLQAYIYIPSDSEAAHRWGYVYTTNEIDLSSANYVKLNITGYGGSAIEACGVYISKLNSLDSPVASKSVTGTGEIVIDVSSLNGSYAIALRAMVLKKGDCYFLAKSIWLD